MKKKLSLLGLGDVGSTLAIGLKLLGGDVLSEINLVDLDQRRINRWEMELNQIVVNPEVVVTKGTIESLFDADIFVFCASKFVPKVGEAVADVRMVQFNANASIVEYYVKMAIEKEYKGIFAIVSDPVDLLCMSAFSKGIEIGKTLNKPPLKSSQIMGFGLGVMDGRAKYYSRSLGFEYEAKGRVFGPHGKDLLVVENIEAYDSEKSKTLTKAVVEANLKVRAEGFKPYVAPALSSGANAILDMLREKWHYSAYFDGEIFFGEYHKRDLNGRLEMTDYSYDEALNLEIKNTKVRLKKLWEGLK